MRILVTGGMGFIGSNFIHYWFRKYPKDEIINLDKLTYAANLKNIEGVERYRYEFIKGDIANIKVVDKIVKDVDMIVNFAAESHVDKSISNSAEFVHSNIIGTHTLLDAAKRYEKRFHQISTDEVYGTLSLKDKRKFDENSPYLPRNPYAATKAAADHLVRTYYNTYKLKVTISNCSNNFGPRQHPEKLIPETIISGLRNTNIPIHGTGLQVRDWIYVEDHCSAIEKILMNGRYGETYLVGANQEMSVIDMVKFIFKKLGKNEELISFVEDRPGQDLRYAIDASKMKEEFGWQRKYEFEESIKLTIGWYKKMLDQNKYVVS